MRISTFRRVLAVAVATLALGAACSGTDGDDEASPAPSDTAPTTTQATASAGERCVDTTDSTDDPQAGDILATAEAVMDELDLKAVVLRVEQGGAEVVTAGLGETLDGVAATPDMHFWNGAALFSYLGNVMLQLDDEGLLDIDAPIAEYRPDVPAADQITPRMLMTSMSGYVDYVAQQDWVDELYADPFRAFTEAELEAYVFDEPLRFEPGTNVGYSHLNFRLAGEVIAAAAGKPLDEVLTERIIEPFGLTSSQVIDTAAIPNPRLHTFTDERGLYEETSSWSAAWGVPEGATMITTVCDLATAGRAVGSGELISAEAFEIYLDPGTVGVGERNDECPTCIPMSADLNFGLGIVRMGDWLVQTPLFTGIAGLQAYLPSEDITIAIANTFGPDADINQNGSTELFRELAPLLAPDAALPEM